MGVLYDMSQRVMREVESRYTNPMDIVRSKGEIARRAGFMVSMVSPGDMDDAGKIDSLRAAAHELGIEV